MVRRVMFVAGEASGDLHGARVVRELKKYIPEVEVYGMGGDNMRSEGMEVLHHASGMAFMGFWEVARNLGMIREVERSLEQQLESRRPDVLVLIDYPGFNLRFARRAKARGIKVLYYIGPQVWAWNKGRVRRMKGVVDRMKVVFPFEVEFYQRAGIPVEFVGHPLAEEIGAPSSREAFCARLGLDPREKIIGLLPGSRKQEIEMIFPTMLRAARSLGDQTGAQVVVGVAPLLGKGPLQRFAEHSPTIILAEKAAHDVMYHSDVVMVTSGTATLETGWFATPMVVVYRTSPLTYAIGRLLVRIDMIGLVNIVAGRKIVPELVQGDLTERNLVHEAGRFLRDGSLAGEIRRELAVVRERLGGPGASARVAEGILELAAA